MSAQIQCKSRLNLKTERLVKLVNLNFSLTYFNHESSDTVKGLCKHKDK